MSILINMEMPESCARCDFFIRDYGCIFVSAVGNALTRGERCEDCPIIEVPPHGRLIDADALLVSIKEARKKQPEIAEVYDDDYFLVAEWLTSAPTVIPADKDGGKNG